MNKPSVIEINGHRYDAVTGRLLDGMQRAVSGVGSVDGIVKRHSQRSINELKRHTQRSQTLMRQAVKKPAKKSAVKKSLINHNSTRDLRHKLAGLRARGDHSQAVVKHHSDQAKEGEVINRSHQAAMAAPMPNLSGNISHQKLEQMLDYALMSADAHQQERKQGKGLRKAFHVLPKWMTFTVIAVLIVVVGGFVAWQKIPAISLKIAASRAHVDSSLPSIPGYTAASPASVKNGELNIKYASINDSSQTATVTKKPAASQDVNSIAKKECPGDKELQTISGNGSVGFICGQSHKAAVVINGVLTEITPNSAESQVSGNGNLLPTP